MKKAQISILMELHSVALKLEPLEPKAVAYWRAMRERTEPEHKSLLDEALLILAGKRLGDWRNKILLSLPPENLLKGSIQLGNVIYDNERWPAALTLEEFLKGVGIYGMTGAGKTNVVFHFLLQLITKKIPWLFVDFKRTGRHLLPLLRERVQVFTPGRALSPFPFNPFIVPPGLDQNVYVSIVSDLMGRAYDFKEAGKYAFQKALRKCYSTGNQNPLIKDIISALKSIDEHEVSRQWKLSVSRSLETIEFANLSAKEKITQEELAKTLLKNHTILEVDGLTESGKAFLLPLLSLWLYYVKLAEPDREQLSYCLVYEEAHNILYGSERSAKEFPIAMILRQARELGIAIIIVDQHPSLISSAALGNAYTTITLNLKDPSDISKAASLSFVDQADRYYFSHLPVGYGIIKLQGRWKRPFLVKFPLVPVDKGSVSDELLSSYLSGKRLSPLSQSINGNYLRNGHFPSLDSLSGDALAFMKDIFNFPNDPIVVRFKRLGFGCKRGERVKEQLESMQLISVKHLRVNNTRRILLSLTKSGTQILSNKLESSNESQEHKFWKQYYSEILDTFGFSAIKVEFPRSLGATDIAGFNKGDDDNPLLVSSIAIEIETGKNSSEDFLHNIKQDLAAKYERILVIATNEKAKNKIERILADSVLLIQSRIRVILRDKFKADDFYTIGQRCLTGSLSMHSK